MLTSSGISRVAAILAAGRAVSNVGGGTNAFVEATAKLSMLLPVYLRLLPVVRPPRRLAADGRDGCDCDAGFGKLRTSVTATGTSVTATRHP